MTRCALVMMLALVTAFPASASAQTVTFAASAPATLPEAFEVWKTGGGLPAQWGIVADATAEGGRALTQTSTDQTNYRFPLAVYRPLSAKDVEVTIRFKPVAGHVDEAGGIAVRLLTPDDYYVARANALENNVRFYRVVKGRRQHIAGIDTTVTPNHWHTLTLRAEGTRFVVAYDGKPLFTAMDATFPREGKVALWTKADSVTHFDRIDIRKLQ